MARTAPSLIPGPEQDRQSSAEEGETKSVVGLKEIIKNVEGLEKETRAGKRRNREDKSILPVQHKNKPDQNGVSDGPNGKLEPKGRSQKRSRILRPFNELPNEHAIEPESGDDGEDAYQSEAKGERAKTSRPEMPAQRNHHQSQCSDARDLVEQRPHAVRE